MLQCLLFPYRALMRRGEMLLVREAEYGVAFCAGARVQACWSGGSHPVWCADLPY